MRVRWKTLTYQNSGGRTAAAVCRRTGKTTQTAVTCTWASVYRYRPSCHHGYQRLTVTRRRYGTASWMPYTAAVYHLTAAWLISQQSTSTAATATTATTSHLDVVSTVSWSAQRRSQTRPTLVEGCLACYPLQRGRLCTSQPHLQRRPTIRTIPIHVVYWHRRQITTCHLVEVFVYMAAVNLLLLARSRCWHSDRCKNTPNLFIVSKICICTTYCLHLYYATLMWSISDIEVTNKTNPLYTSDYDCLNICIRL